MNASASLPTTADMSALPFRVLPSRKARTEKNRQYKAAQRARDRERGFVKLEIRVPESEAQLIEWLRTAQAGNPETFLSRALVTGAKFVYNAGNVRGGKKRIKGAVTPEVVSHE